MPRAFVAVMILATCVACGPGEQAPPAEEVTPAEEATPAEEPAPAPEASAERGTLEEARAMLDRAVAHYEEVGREQALADFTAGEEPFVDRDLYVFCYGPDRTISAHGADESLIGEPIDELRDVDDKAFATEIWEVAHQEGGGTVEYQWLNPVTGQVEPKVSVVRVIGEDVCGVGAYRTD